MDPASRQNRKQNSLEKKLPSSLIIGSESSFSRKNRCFYIRQPGFVIIKIQITFFRYLGNLKTFSRGTDISLEHSAKNRGCSARKTP